MNRRDHPANKRNKNGEGFLKNMRPITAGNESFPLNLKFEKNHIILNF